MTHWRNSAAVAALLTGLLAGAVAATGAAAIADNGVGASRSAVTAPVSCQPLLSPNTGGTVTFGPLHPTAL